MYSSRSDAEPREDARTLPGPDAPVLIVGDGRSRRLPDFAMELIAFAAIGIAVMLLIPGSTLTRVAGALALVALACWRGYAHGREIGAAARALPPLAFAACISGLAIATAEPLYDVILCFNVLLVALQENRRTVALVVAGTWIALIPPALVHPEELGLRAAVWAALLPILAVPVQRRSEELRNRVGLGPKLRALQATMLSDPDSRETLVTAAPELARCDVVTLIEPDSTGTFVVTASNVPGAAGSEVPDADNSLVHRVVRTGKPVFVPDAHRADGLPARLRDEFGDYRTWFCAPVMRSGLVAAVLCTGWRNRIAKPDHLRIDIVRSLASEASTTIDHTDLLRSLSDTASRDPLTGLINRRGWDGLLAKEMAISRSRRTPLSVAIIDLDRFKDFNDVHGHRAGDRLLPRRRPAPGRRRSGTETSWRAGAARSSPCCCPTAAAPAHSTSSNACVIEHSGRRDLLGRRGRVGRRRDPGGALRADGRRPVRREVGRARPRDARRSAPPRPRGGLARLILSRAAPSTSRPDSRRRLRRRLGRARWRPCGPAASPSPGSAGRRRPLTRTASSRRFRPCARTGSSGPRSPGRGGPRPAR